MSSTDVTDRPDLLTIDQCLSIRKELIEALKIHGRNFTPLMRKIFIDKKQLLEDSYSAMSVEDRRKLDSLLPK